MREERREKTTTYVPRRHKSTHFRPVTESNIKGVQAFGECRGDAGVERPPFRQTLRSLSLFSFAFLYATFDPPRAKPSIAPSRSFLCPSPAGLLALSSRPLPRDCISDIYRR